jgi:hypothetical protein
MFMYLVVHDRVGIVFFFSHAISTVYFEHCVCGEFLDPQKSWGGSDHFPSFIEVA